MLESSGQPQNYIAVIDGKKPAEYLPDNQPIKKMKIQQNFG